MTTRIVSKAQSGFTLLEVLMAITITALIGLGAWQLLNSAIRTYELGQENLQALSLLKRAQLSIRRDFSQVLPRPIRDEFGDYQPALKSSEEFYAVEFTRIGWRNPLQERRSELQRVAYELSDGDLLRHHWKVVDRAQDSLPVTRRLLTDVERFEIAYLNESNAWVDEWPPRSEAGEEESPDPTARFAVLPKAVRIELDHPRYGVITRLFDQASYLENALLQASDGNNSGGADGNTDDPQSDSSGTNAENGNAGAGTNGNGTNTSGGLEGGL